jgi:hypothetical protein
LIATEYSPTNSAALHEVGIDPFKGMSFSLRRDSEVRPSQKSS